MAERDDASARARDEPDDSVERIEIRDGREYKVTVLPDAEPKRRLRRKIGGKRYAKHAALAAPQLRFCPKCQRDRPIGSFDRKVEGVPANGLCFACRKARAARKAKQ